MQVIEITTRALKFAAAARIDAQAPGNLLFVERRSARYEQIHLHHRRQMNRIGAAAGDDSPSQRIGVRVERVTTTGDHAGVRIRRGVH